MLYTTGHNASDKSGQNMPHHSKNISYFSIQFEASSIQCNAYDPVFEASAHMCANKWGGVTRSGTYAPKALNNTF